MLRVLKRTISMRSLSWAPKNIIKTDGYEKICAKKFGLSKSVPRYNIIKISG